MIEFATEREAKEFLAERIAEEARRQGEPLTEVERKMLYFSESGWTLPDMADVADTFARTYDDQEYEQKIGALCRAVRKRFDEDEKAAWSDAVRRLGEGDHYLSVMLDEHHSRAVELGWRRWLRIEELTACGAAVAGFLLTTRYRGLPENKNEFGFNLWIALLIGGVAYGAIYSVRHRH